MSLPQPSTNGQDEVEPVFGLPGAALSAAEPIPARVSRYPGDFVVEFHRRPIELLRETAARHGDVVALRQGSEPLILVTHPDLVREVLVTRNTYFKKGKALENARSFLGDGLLTSEGEFHRRQRRMMQPAFHRRQIERYANAVQSGAEEASRRWHDGETVEVLTEMMAITMPIVAGTLFGASGMRERTQEITDALNTIMNGFRTMMLPGAHLLQKLPLPAIKRLRSAESTLHSTTARIIAERRAAMQSASGAASGSEDLLEMLLESHDDESGAAETRMTDQQIHDEVLTLFTAGHETTSVWLAWTWYLLATHPRVEQSLRDELATVLQGRAPSYSDLPNLPSLRCVLQESLRLYPPAWAIGRRAIQDVRLGAHEIKAGSIILLAPIVTHADPRFWPDPLAFNPERWLDEAAAAERPKFAFFPFGAGPRVCIGEQFAWMEASLLLAALMQNWKLHLAPGVKVQYQPAVTLRPKRGIPMCLEKIAS